MNYNNGDIRWNKQKKADRDAAEAKEEILRSLGKMWDSFKARVKKGIHVNYEQIEAMLVEFQREAHQAMLKLPEDQIKHFREFTDVLINDCRVKMGIKDSPAAILKEAERIMQANTITQKLPDGSDGESYGFTSTDSMLAVPFVQNCNDLDLIGFAMHGSVLCALYSGGLKPNVRVVGIVKYPTKVILPSLLDMAGKLKEKGLTFPEIPPLVGPERN